jgi:Fur family ferric uptake transcriptional regulator
MKTRNTRQKEIIENQIKKFNTFFSADDLIEKISKTHKNIGIATVYRYLKDLRDKELIYSYTCGGKIIYSYTNRSHCHFECLESGKVVHFELNNLDFLKGELPGEIESFQLEIKGRLK